jgi:hypothetical protein
MDFHAEPYVRVSSVFHPWLTYPDLYSSRRTKNRAASTTEKMEAVLQWKATSDGTLIHTNRHESKFGRRSAISVN